MLNDNIHRIQIGPTNWSGPIGGPMVRAIFQKSNIGTLFFIFTTNKVMIQNKILV